MRFKTILSAAACCVSAFVSCETYASGDSHIGGVLSAWSCGVKLCSSKNQSISDSEENKSTSRCSFLGVSPAIDRNIKATYVGYARPAESSHGRVVSLPNSNLYATLKGNEVRFSALHNKIDANNDGKISREEAASFFKSDKSGAYPKYWEDLTKGYQDKSGSVSNSRFILLSDALFKRGDLDKNDVLDPFEISSLDLQRLGIYGSARSVVGGDSCAGLVAADGNGNGSVSRDELNSYAELVTSTIDIDYDGFVSKVEYDAVPLRRCFDDKVISIVIQKLLKSGLSVVPLEDILESIDAAFESLDITSDGGLDREEYEYYLSNNGQLNPGIISGASADSGEVNKNLLVRIDRDKNRYADLSEFSSFVLRRVRLLDLNADGRISDSEFRRFKERQLSIGNRLKRNPIYIRLLSSIFSHSKNLNVGMTFADLELLVSSYFKLLDNDGDQRLSVNELTANAFDRIAKSSSAVSGTSVLVPDYAHIVASYDDNGDDKLNGAEYYRFLNSIFVSLDSDKDGKITISELFALTVSNERLKQFGIPSFELSQVRNIINLSDDSTDGFIDSKEFQAATRRLFYRSDVDNSGELSIKELDQSYKILTGGTSGGIGGASILLGDKEYVDFYKSIDLDGIGGVSKQEFRAYDDSNFRKIDKDSSGSVERSEFDTYYNFAGMHLPASEVSRLNVLYDKYFIASDINKNQIMSSAESLVSSDRTFKTLDNNGDGSISPSELKNFYDERTVGAESQPGGSPVNGSMLQDSVAIANQDYKEMDSDRNGSVTLAEYIDFQDKILELVDSDRSSGITSKEFKVLVSETSGSSEYQRIRFHYDIFQKYKGRNDVDTDGEITFRENRNLFSDLFLEVDEDGSATINLKELKQFYKVIGRGVSSAEVDGPEGVNFATMDSDKSGGVTLNEHRAYFASRFLKMDADHDGSVTKSESDSFYIKNFTKYTGRDAVEHKHQFDKAFSEADLNSDMIVTSSELNSFSDVVFSEIDLNRDGVISLDEATRDHDIRYGVGSSSNEDLLDSGIHDTDGNFSQMDANKSGGISREENQDFYIRRIYSFDTNGDGSVSKRESDDYYKANFTDLTGDAAIAHKKLYDKAYADADINHDDLITKDEIIQFAKSVFDVSDLNGNNSLSAEEVLLDHDKRYRDFSNVDDSVHAEDGNFSQMDVNKSGGVSREENQDFYIKRTLSLDTNGDGLVSKREYESFYKSNFTDLTGDAAVAHKKLSDKAYADADINHDDLITKDEIIQFAKSVFDVSDLNGNNSLSAEEVLLDHDKRYRDFSNVDDSVHAEDGNFSQMDVNKSGGVSREENQDFYIKRTLSLDTNGDGLVSKREYESFYKSNFTDLTGDAAVAHKKLSDKAYADADINHDDLITKDEIIQFAKSVFDVSDLNGNNSLSAEEVLLDHDKRYRDFSNVDDSVHAEDGNFSQMDVNKSGGVSREENQDFYIKRTLSLDTNGDGLVSKREYESFYKSNFTDLTGDAAVAHKKLSDKAYADADINHDDLITKDEIIQFAKSVFDVSDLNGNNSLSAEEVLLDHDKRYRDFSNVDDSVHAEDGNFSQMDVNKSGGVSREENQDFYIKRTLSLDTNGDGLVYKREYESFYKSNFTDLTGDAAVAHKKLSDKAYADADINHDDLITKDEIIQFAKSVFDVSDLNGNNSLSAEEVLLDHDKRYRDFSNVDDSVHAEDGNFSQMDVNKSGGVSREENQDFYIKRTLSLDTNGDGLVSKREYESFYKSNFTDLTGDAAVAHKKLSDKAYADADINHDDLITKDEIIQFAKSVFDVSDLNGNNSLSAEEVLLDHDERYRTKVYDKGGRNSEDVNFNAMDIDGSGAVTKRENYEYYAKRWHEMDRSGDGSISRIESDSFFLAHYNEGGDEDVGYRRILYNKAFSDADENSDSIVTSGEVVRFADEVFESSDSDNNGLLSPYEVFSKQESDYISGESGVISGSLNESVAGKVGNGIVLFETIDLDRNNQVAESELRKFYEGKYSSMDADRNGVLTIKEVGKYVEMNSVKSNASDVRVLEDVFDKYFRAADLNSDSGVTLNELKSFSDSEFDLIDSDNSGILSVNEVVIYVDSSYYPIESGYGDIFSYIDIDNDMMISSSEFLVYYRDNFSMIDSNNDLYITMEEAEERVLSSSDSIRQSLLAQFKLADVNNDQKVSLQENLEFAESRFIGTDTDGDGYVNMEELVSSK